MSEELCDVVLSSARPAVEGEDEGLLGRDPLGVGVEGAADLLVCYVLPEDVPAHQVCKGGKGIGAITYKDAFTCSE